MAALEDPKALVISKGSGCLGVKWTATPEPPEPLEPPGPTEPPEPPEPP